MKKAPPKQPMRVDRSGQSMAALNVLKISVTSQNFVSVRKETTEDEFFVGESNGKGVRSLILHHHCRTKSPYWCTISGHLVRRLVSTD